MKFLSVLRHNPIVFPLACLAALAMVLISESSFWQSAQGLTELREAGATRNSLQDLQQGLLDAETGQRGYLLTERKEYLLPYTQAQGRIQAALARLHEAYRDEPDSLVMLKQLHAMTQAKQSELALTISLHDRGKAASSRDMVLTDIGREKMEAIRILISQLQELENANLIQGRDSLYRTLLLSRTGMAVLSLFSLLALFMYLRQSLALSQQRQQLQDVVQREHDRLEIEVAQRTAELSELTRHLLSAREDERHRLARNLHDDLGALLTAAKLDAARIRPRLVKAAPEALDLLAHLVGTLNASVALGRSIIEDLRPSALSNLGLVAALEILTREFAEQTDIEVHCTLQAVKLPASTELMIFRLVQEATTNIAKYARARQVWVTLQQQGEHLEVSVRDDGVGFDPHALLKSAYGLMGMRFRVKAEGGTLTLVSSPGAGTLIRAQLPLNARPQASTAD